MSFAELASIADAMEQAAIQIDEQVQNLCLYLRVAVTRARADCVNVVTRATSRRAAAVVAITRRCRINDKCLTERAEEMDANVALLAAVASLSGTNQHSWLSLISLVSTAFDALPSAFASNTNLPTICSVGLTMSPLSG